MTGTLLALPVLLWFEYYRAGAVGGIAARVRATFLSVASSTNPHAA